MVIESTQLLEIAIGGYSIHIHEGVNVLRDDLFVAKPLTKDLNGLLVVGGGESESSDSIKGCVFKQRSQVVELVNFGEFRVQVNRCLIRVPEGGPLHRVPIESGQGNLWEFHLRSLNRSRGSG